MHHIFRKPALKIFICVTAALALGCLISALSHSGTSPLSKVTGFIFSPVQKLAASVSEGLSDLPYSFRSSTVLSEENNTLREEISSLKSQLVELEQLRRQNELYKQFLELKEENPDQQYCEASIIGRNNEDFAGEFTLGKGSLSGISVQDPVVYGNCLVGVVSAVNPTTCTVKTILNPDVNVSCYEIRTATTGYATTTVELSEQGLCHMPNLAGDTAITTGGTVCTSGVGGVYPKDLRIGTVKAINDATVDISAAAVIEPDVDFSTITGVFVITSFEGQGID